MSIEGRIAIDIGFTDTYTAGSVQSVQRIALTATDSYTSGKVAVFSGTIGTAAATIAVAPNSHLYRDASGQIVSFSAFDRIAFITSRSCELNDNLNGSVPSKGNLCIFDSGGQELELIPGYTSGTASYTVVVWGT